MVVVVDKDIYDAKSVEEPSVEQAFQETVQEGRIGILSVDPTSLQLRSPSIYLFPKRKTRLSFLEKKFS